MNQTIFLELDFYRTSYRSVKAHQYDKDTRFIEVTCIKDAIPYPLDPATMTCNLKLQTPDGRHMFKTETIKPNGKIFIALEESMLLAAGICKAELNVYDIDSKKLLSTMPFDLIVIGSVYDNSIIEDSDEFSVLNDMIFYNKELGDRLEQLEADVTEAESERNENEETRKDNEINRQQNEIERQSNEITRQTNESVREASEDIRIENENFRKGNEDDRQGNEVIRQNNESIRESNETVRQNNELIRQSNESTREAEEEIRNANEDVRKNNEVTRQECETIRQTNESVRETGEDTRNTNEETRKNNEIDRQNAEKDRNNTFEQLQDTIDTKLANIEKVNIEPVSEANSYQIKVTDRNGNITTSPNLLHRLQIGTVETGDSDEEPTASITGDFGEQKLNLRLPTGKPFKIHKTYPSISEMNADVDNIELYEFVLIHTGSVEDEDTGKLYMKDISGMLFLTDLSGVQGIQGETGATPNLSIGSVTTGEPGTEASVQISGTKENPLLHLTIPRGEPGTIEDLSPEDIGALPVLTSSPSYNTFEDFWSDANKHGIKTSSHMCAMRFKDTGGWTPSLGWWCAIVGFQNGIGSQWSVTGRILLMSTGLAQGGQHVYYGLVDGGSTTTPEVSVTWYKVYSEIDKPSPDDIGALNYYSREELGIERSYIEDIIAALPNNSLYQGYAKKEDPVVAAAGITDNYSDLRIFKRSAWLIAVTVTTFGNRTYHWAGNSENPVKLVGTLPLTGGTVTGTIKSDKFEGGRGIFTGTYVSDPTQRYQCGALEIRENDRVTSDQTDMAYAPTIGFHWGNRTAAMLLYHSDAKFYFRHQDGVSRATVDANLIGAVVPSGGIEYTGKDGWIGYPSDGDYQTDAASVTGYLVINLPQSWTDTMIKFAVTIFNYVTDTSVEYHISGYTYLDGKSWYNCSATCIGRAGAKTSNLTVRFGHDGTRCVILIGEPDSVWEYPHVKIHDVLLGLHNKEYSKWHSGWGVYISATTRPTITRTVSNTHVGYGSNASMLGGMIPQGTPGANTIVTRDSAGYSYFYYINSNTMVNENPTISQVIVTNGNDGFYRKASIVHLATSLGLKTSVLFTSTENVGIDSTSSTGIGYVTGSSGTGLFSDGALYRQSYSDAWTHEIYGDYRTGQIAVRGKNNGTWGNWRIVMDNENIVNYNAGGAYVVKGTYTGNGGAQPPSYVPSGIVRFNMMDRFPGFSVNGYMDTILMDTYTGGDVPWVTGIGVTKAAGNPRMFIAAGSKGNSAG